MAIMLAWQALTVHYNFGGNWTALFCTGELLAPPAELKSEGIYRFPGFGYDGQFYHYIAHDPLITRNFAKSMDAPRLRYRRIFVPAVAFVLALGQDRAIDFGCIAAFALSVLLGSYWLSRFAVFRGLAPAWGLLFCLAPAVPISADRLTVDAALAACCTGFALYLWSRARTTNCMRSYGRGSRPRNGPAPHCRVRTLPGRNPRFSPRNPFLDSRDPCRLLVRFRCSCTLRLAATAFISPATICRILPPHPESFPLPFYRANGTPPSDFDLLALAGIGAALVWALYRAFGHAWTPVTVAIWLFAILTITLSNADAWSEVYAFGRTLTPLVLLSVLDGLAIGSMLPVYAMLGDRPANWPSVRHTNPECSARSLPSVLT